MAPTESRVAKPERPVGLPGVLGQTIS